MMTTRAAWITTVLLLSSGVVSATEPAVEHGLKPDAKPILYTDRVPTEGTPQFAMVNLVLLREQGRQDEAASWISKTCPDWLRDGMLQADGPMNQATLSYQLREFTPTKALVSVDYNTESGTFKGWTRSVIRENGKWVVR